VISYFIFMILTMVFFIRWFRRAYFNLHLRTKNLQHTEGWAAGAWFVPIFNLYAPVQIMSDLFNESLRELKKVGKASPVAHPGFLVGIWWLFWLLRFIINSYSSVVSRNLTSLDQIMLTTKLVVFGSLASIVAAFLCIQLVQRYAKIEPLLDDMTSEIDLIGETEADY
jgi:dolichol kinase